MIAHDYRTQIRRLIDDVNEGDSTALDHALRLAVRSGDRLAQLHLVGLKIRPQGAENCRFVIDGEEDNGLRIPKTLDPVLAFSVTLCWDARIARLFAADVAEHVLHIFESEYPDDLRPRKAIEVVRTFARGQDTREELSAAGDAAWHAVRAAGNAAWHAARDAVRATAWAAWNAARAAGHPTGHAAEGAWATALDARDAAAHQTEQAWQKERLLAYLLGEVDP